MKLFPERLVVRMSAEMIAELAKIGQEKRREPAEIMRAAAQAVIEAYQRDKDLPQDFEIRQKVIGKQWAETYPEPLSKTRVILNEPAQSAPTKAHGKRAS